MESLKAPTALVGLILTLAAGCASAPRVDPAVAGDPEILVEYIDRQLPKLPPGMTCGPRFYPAESVRLKQRGVVVVRLCIGTDNKIDRPIAVLVSSGMPKMDEAARKCFGLGRYRAGTLDGKPVNSCADYKVTFTLDAITPP